MAHVSNLPTASSTITTTEGSRGELIAFASIVLAYWASWVTFPAVWLDNRTHGFLALGVSLWSLWSSRARLAGNPSKSALTVLLVLGAASFMWSIGQILSVQFVHQLAVPAVLWLWLLATRGEVAARAAVPALLVFSLALPIWEILMWPLQLAAATISGLVVKLFGVNAVISREIITLNWGKLEVAGSCSGLGFFLTALSFGAAYALFFVRRPALQWRIVAWAAVMAVVANWVRVIGLVLIADASRMTSPLMKDHELFGWVIFLAAMLTWFFVASRLERQDTHSPLTTDSSIAPEPPFHQAPLLPNATTWSTRVLAAATFVAISGPILLFSVRLVPSKHELTAKPRGIVAGAPFSTIVAPSPRDSGAYVWSPAFRAPSYRTTEWWASGSDSVRLDHFGYVEERQGAELIGAENRVTADSLLLEERVVGPLDANLRTVRQAVVREGKRARMVWFWYRVAGIETSSDAKAKLLSLLAFFQRREGGDVTFVSVGCRDGDCRHAVATLYRFVTGNAIPASQLDSR